MKNWAVKNDGSKLFKDTIIKYLNDNYDENWLGLDINSFYGFNTKNDYTNHIDSFSSANGTFISKEFPKNNRILKIEEFIQLIK